MTTRESQSWIAGQLVAGPEIVVRAAGFAATCHGKIDQRRKYTNEPYIKHPAAVAQIVAEALQHNAAPTAFDRDAMIAAAWLHDVVEDTEATTQDLDSEFGSQVADLVGWLTDVSTPADGNRAARMAIDWGHSARAPAEAQTIKLADLIDNTRTIVRFDPSFARVYLREKDELLRVMGKGNADLWQRARWLCDDGLKRLTQDATCSDAGANKA